MNDVLKNVGDQTTVVSIHFYCMEIKPMLVNGYRHCSGTNIFQNSFCDLQIFVSSAQGFT